MKAILVTEFGETEFLKLMDVPVPEIGANEVLIKVIKTSVNFADIKSRYGKKGARLPFIPGLDAAGYIVDVGANVKDLHKGDRVIAFPRGGTYAEFAVASEQLVFKIPEELDFATAAAAPIVSFLSHRLLKDVARIQAGESVLVHAAAGGVGTTASQLARLMGAGKVFGTVGSQDKMALAMESGADHVLCYQEEDFAARVNELTNGAGVDIVLDSISGTVTEKSLECLAPYGRLVHFGNSSGETGNFKTIDLHSSCRSVLGFSLGTTRKLRPHLMKETADEVIPYLASKKIDIKIGHEFLLSDAAKAHELMENRLNKGKIVLSVGQE